ncbi:MAG: type II toxin-antitoxin system RelE/ParE family toxin [Stagnimonas sp.]|nr:type II toxin-antitoxin system RelE/ParE family toxin [Stagnimonas sp.]
MVEVRQTKVFAKWFTQLRDGPTQRRIQVRIDRLQMGNPGQHRLLAGGVAELKIDVGPGYRVYYTQHGAVLVILLCGGDKATQDSDIKTALALAQGLSP